MAIKQKLDSIKKYYDLERGNRELYLWNYYLGRSVPVFKRQPVSDVKAQSHTNTHEDFMKDIIDLKVGYMGQDITINYDGTDSRVGDKLKEINMYNNLDILNSDTVRKSAISGMSHRLLYTKSGSGPGDGKIKMKNIGPGDGLVVYEYDDNIYDPEAAYFYYVIVDVEGKKKYHCDVYDRKMVTYYRDDNTQQDIADGFAGHNTGNYQFIGRNYKRRGAERHNFGEVPIIPFMNNDTWTGDCDKVIGHGPNRDGLMDVYDEILSDTASEVKAMRLAYLKIYGKLYTGLDASGNKIDINTWLKQTSTMNFPTDEDGKRVGDAEFLEKKIQDTIIENMLNRLRMAIYEKSGSVDIKQISDGANQRVISIRTQLMRLENNCSTTESYMRAGLYKMMRLISYWMREYFNISVKDSDFSIKFERVTPSDAEFKSKVLLNLTSAGLSMEDSLVEAGFDNAISIAERALGASDGQEI